jgi:hypothetical protein
LPKSAVVFLAGLAVVPAVVLGLYGHTMVMPPLWVHFYGVGVSALVAAAAAATLVTIGARRHDARTVVVAGGFTIMATLLAVHGLVTPGVLVGDNGVIALTGAATLPVGAAVLALSSLPWLSSPRSIPLVIGLQAAIAAVIVAVSTLGVLVPRLVPSVPNARSNAAWTLLAVGLVLFAALAIRAANTFLLTRRSADLAVVVGLVLLSSSLYGALALGFMDLGWWIGHVFELVGIALVGGSVAYDLRRGSQSRPLVGDLRLRDRRRRGGVPRGPRAGADGAACREGRVDGGAHTARRRARGRSGGAAWTVVGTAALARDRRPAPRRRQALGAERDPAEAGPARRRRVRSRQAASRARP